MSHDHSHASGAAAASAGARYRERLLVAFGLMAAFMVVEVVAGLATNSLALLSDAGHMLTDVIGLGMALAAIQLASRASRNAPPHLRPLPARDPRRAGQRGAAVRRRRLRAGRGGRPVSATRPRCSARPMLVVAVAGPGRQPRRLRPAPRGCEGVAQRRGRLPRGPVRHDRLGRRDRRRRSSSQVTGWGWVDPVVGVGIGLFILPRTWRLGAQAVRILVQAAPAGHRPRRGAGRAGDASTASSTSTTSTSGPSPPRWRWLSAHLMVTAGTDRHAVLDQARDLLRDPLRHRPRDAPDRARRPRGLRRAGLVAARPRR